jgi:hypothetical protein
MVMYDRCFTLSNVRLYPQARRYLHPIMIQTKHHYYSLDEACAHTIQPLGASNSSNAHTVLLVKHSSFESIDPVNGHDAAARQPHYSISESESSAYPTTLLTFRSLGGVPHAAFNSSAVGSYGLAASYFFLNAIASSSHFLYLALYSS